MESNSSAFKSEISTHQRLANLYQSRSKDAEVRLEELEMTLTNAEQEIKGKMETYALEMENVGNEVSRLQNSNDSKDQEVWKLKEELRMARERSGISLDGSVFPHSHGIPRASETARLAGKAQSNGMSFNEVVN